MRPEALARELGVSGKTLRSWLRQRFPRSATERYARWDLTPGQVEAARRRFPVRWQRAQSRRGMVTTTVALPVGLHRRLTAAAAAKRVPMTELLRRIVAASLATQDRAPAEELGSMSNPVNVPIQVPAVARPIPKPEIYEPHVFILGAGASLAAFPDGDRNGRRLPLMADLVARVGLGPILDRAGVAYGGEDFEALYSRLVGPQYDDCRAELERKLVEYFSGMKLPHHPTLYDHLILSLRAKDMIATFNWDPFLIQAVARCEGFAPVPHLAILHGSTFVSYCGCRDPVLFGIRKGQCKRCGEQVKNVPLLYPITQKDYSSDPLIAAGWKDLRMVLKRAYLLTIFGYSAPETDVEAMQLMSEAWGDPDERRMEEIEVIDVKQKAVLAATWRHFIHTTHWGRYESLHDTFAMRHPRRSCEALWNATQMNNPDHEQRLPQHADWPELREFLRPLIEQEREAEQESGAGQ